ncbi:MAG: hypothetical protein ACRDVD_01575 [Acidimicrobiia bacterium]
MTPPLDIDTGVGCRPGALAGMGLLGGALLVGGAGLWLVTQRGTGLALFYAAAPVSALLGVLGGGLPVAWPLDLAVWVVAGVVAAAWAGRTGRPVWQAAMAIGVVALVFGFVMSQFVEVDRLSV